ncbi:kininogen-1 [Coturnix japonica]|uniref:Kininogen 1 n=1 Tax=Coturnix japonica TaxID=93934 RepID=A0A8C2TP66_COTJA|nr:kininogen-1 [Coturnix japonica]
MKLFVVVALCCSFFSTRATPLPFEFSDCDDPDVLEAVDTALQKYNGDSTTGNQFALYMVMEAKRTVGPDKQFHVRYQIRETTCATGENKLWKDCDYKASAEAKTGECTARVHMNNAEKTSNVSQDCRIVSVQPVIPLTQNICLGCYHTISSDSSRVSEILQKAIQKFNTHSGEAALFKLVEITEARRQVVAGFNYIIKYEIKETNCSKDQFQDLTHECKTTSGGRVGKCDAKAYENLQSDIVDVASQCNFPAEELVNPPTRVCPGCPSSIPTDSAELKELLKVSVEKYNSETNDDFYYQAEEIESATVQVVAGQNYHLVFFARKTNCSKKEFEKLHEDCEASTDSLSLRCEAQIYVVPWENKTFPQVNCSTFQLMTAMVRRPPGFTPLRSFAVVLPVDGTTLSNANERETQKAGEETRKDDGQGPDGEGEPGHKHRHKHKHGLKKDHESAKRHRQETDCGHRNGHRCGHRKHGKHGKHGKHKHHKPESSEESGERVFNLKEALPSSTAETALELVNAEVVRTEASTPTEPVDSPDISSFNGLPDHTESPPLRCPGKPWKPIPDLLIPSNLPREFLDEDLLPSAAENIDLTTENPLPPQNEEMSFDLADALQ